MTARDSTDGGAVLAARQRRYDVLVEESPDPVFCLSASGEYLYANRAHGEALARPVEEIVGHTLWDFFSQADADARFATLTEVFRTGTTKVIEGRVPRADGDRHYLTTVCPARDPDGRVVSAICSAKDITERRTAEASRAKLERQLLRNHKLESIGALAAGIAHEINTPTQYASDNMAFVGRGAELLSGIARASVALLAELPPDQPGRAALELAIQQARLDFTLQELPRALEQTLEGLSRISKIVGAMKDFSHPSTGMLEPTDLSHAISTTIAIARNEWKYVADVETHFAPDLPLVPTLRDELSQVLLNLIVNAAHAIGEVVVGTDERGRITISTRAEDRWALVEVADTGAGIPESVRPHIFEPFFTTKPLGKGTGQGLAMAYGVITEGHRGRINFESTPGKGTSFFIRLPLVRSESSVSALLPDAARGAPP